MQHAVKSSRMDVVEESFLEVTGNRQTRALFTGPKKISVRSPTLASARIAPKIFRVSSRQYTRSTPNFIQIRSLPAELKPNAWTSLKRATKNFQYSAKLLRRVKIRNAGNFNVSIPKLIWSPILCGLDLGNAIYEVLRVTNRLAFSNHNQLSIL